MKIRILLLAVLLAVPAAFFLRAEDPQQPKKQPKDETELEGKMEVMGSAFRKLRNQVGDATKNADSLELVARIRAAATEAVKLTPAKTADLPASDRAKFVADYQAKMKGFFEQLEKLEAVLKAGKNDEAAKLIADIRAFQKEAHKQFERPDADKK